MKDIEFQGETSPRAAGLAEAISVCTFPPFMGIVAFLVISICLADGIMTLKTFAVGFVTSTVVPLMVTLHFAKKEKDNDEFGDIRNSHDRLVPMGFIIISYAAGATILFCIGAPEAAYLSMISYFLSTAFAMAVSTRWKISLHAMGIVGPATALSF